MSQSTGPFTCHSLIQHSHVSLSCEGNRKVCHDGNFISSFGCILLLVLICRLINGICLISWKITFPTILESFLEFVKHCICWNCVLQIWKSCCFPKNVSNLTVSILILFVTALACFCLFVFFFCSFFSSFNCTCRFGPIQSYLTLKYVTGLQVAWVFAGFLNYDNLI